MCETEKHMKSADRIAECTQYQQCVGTAGGTKKGGTPCSTIFFYIAIIMTSEQVLKVLKKCSQYYVKTNLSCCKVEITSYLIFLLKTEKMSDTMSTIYLVNQPYYTLLVLCMSIADIIFTPAHHPLWILAIWAHHATISQMMCDPFSAGSLVLL